MTSPAVVIIGAGPAGLATAACLAERGVGSTILERGDQAFAALRTVDPEMQLLTPRALSRVPGMSTARGAHRTDPYPTWRELIEELEAWRVARGLEITSGAEVEHVDRVDDGFVVRYRRAGALHVVQATHVVNTTGIIAHPVVPPELVASAYTRRWLHSRDVRTEHLATADDVLVVGGGTSAAEVIERWLAIRHGAGGRITLSTRRPVIAVPHRILGVDIHWWLYVPERLPGRMIGEPLGLRRDLVIGRALSRALRAGHVAHVPAVERYERDTIVVRGGARLTPDLLILATGFSYEVSHLGDLVERDRTGYPIVDRHSASPRANNLYLLGVRFGRSNRVVRAPRDLSRCGTCRGANREVRVKQVVVRRFGGASELSMVDVADPVPGDGEVLVAIDACGVNFADLAQREGRYLGGPIPPFVPGIEAAGTVIGHGGNVTSPAIGTHVMIVAHGGLYAERAVVRADRCVPVPDELATVTAAAFPVALPRTTR